MTWLNVWLTDWLPGWLSDQPIICFFDTCFNSLALALICSIRLLLDNQVLCEALYPPVHVLLQPSTAHFVGIISICYMHFSEGNKQNIQLRLSPSRFDVIAPLDSCPLHPVVNQNSGVFSVVYRNSTGHRKSRIWPSQKKCTEKILMAICLIKKKWGLGALSWALHFDFLPSKECFRVGVRSCCL